MTDNEIITEYDRDFFGDKINIGDRVVFEAPGYRHFVLGKVITKAPKSCQIEYINDWNYAGVKERENNLDLIRIQNKINSKMFDKPIIRHCRNCKYSFCRYCTEEEAFVIDCRVKYKKIYSQRLTALFCRHYKRKEEKL